MRAKRADGGVEPGLRMFTSTPQSIAKPSPGWNKVALLTAVRNSPCSCPFSVSLTRPQDALNSEPRVGSLLVCLTTSPVHTPLAYFTWRSHISLRISAISPCASRISLRTKVRFTVKCSKIVYRLCNHMVYSFDILKASQKKRKRWRWLGRKGLWK